MLIRDKYVPRSIDEFVFETDDMMHTINDYVAVAAQCNPGHLLLVGRVGTAKSTLAKLIAQAVFAPSYDLDVSSFSGFDFDNPQHVRKSIKNAITFASISATYRMVVIDEIDAMTSASQGVLASMMDHHQKNCVFILTGNDIGSIDERIISRCRTVRFVHADERRWLRRAKQIMTSEKVVISDDGLLALLATAHGDIRQMLRIIQDKITIERSKISSPAT